ncbi:MAG: FIST C-terminal domain-containing protein [Planctomycetes bacterium]|nr:FIST C-terminal domain-containing protein [Planctomycetota bacterium]
MPSFAGSALSKEAVARVAGRAAATAACAALHGRPAHFCLVFATSGHDPQEVLAGVREVAGGARLAGCSAEGVIGKAASEESFRAVGVLAVHSDQIDFEPLLVRGYGADPAGVGRAIAERVRAHWRGDEFALLLLPDGLRGSASDLLAALDAGLPRPLPVVGGAAGDALVFEGTTQFCDGEVASDAVTAVVLRGAGRLEFALSHGCRGIGIERTITAAHGPWVETIDHQPAWQVFRQFLDGDPDDLNTEGAIYLSVGLPVPPNADDTEPLRIRTPLGLDKANGALLFPGGGLAQGSVIRLARRDPDAIRSSARRCAERLARAGKGEAPLFVLQFDCAGRGKQLFGSRTADELVLPLQTELGGAAPWLGFYTYGEIAPADGRSCYHNFTVALCGVYPES